jgi:hypothetical protein
MIPFSVETPSRVGPSSVGQSPAAAEPVRRRRNDAQRIPVLAKLSPLVRRARSPVLPRFLVEIEEISARMSRFGASFFEV